MNQKKIGEFIAKLRKEKNMTQEQFAEKLGVSNKSISRWENGTNMPDYSLLKDVCEELDITINELMSGEKIEKENYMSKAEENFIFLKKKVDRVIKILDIINWTMTVLAIILFIAHMYFNWLYRGPWDDSQFIIISRILLIITLSASFLISLLRYETLK